MVDYSEEKRLLPSKARVGHVNNDENVLRALQRRLFITMFVITVLNRGAEGMAGVTLKQFIYSWCKNRTASTNNVDRSNSTINSSDACGKTESSASEDAAQKMASSWEQYFNILYAVLVYLNISIFGTLSDYTGRKFFLCLSIFGYSVKCGIIAVVIYFDLHIVWLFPSYFIDGIFGSSYSMSYLAYVATADVTRHPDARVFGVAVMEMFMGIGMLSTQFFSGYFIQAYGYLYPIIASTGLCLLSGLVCLVLFQETLRDEVKDHVTGQRKWPTCTTLFRRYISFYVTSDSRNDRNAFLLCLLVFGTLEMASQGKSDPLTLYQLGRPFCWSSDYIGWYSAASMFATIIMGCLILKPLQMCFHSNHIACLGIMSAIAVDVIIGVAKSTSWIFASLGFAVLSFIPKSILRGLASSRAPSNLQGAMFAGLESSELVCKMIAVPGALAIYSATVDTWRGFVFFVLASINVLCLIFMIILTCLLKKQSREKNIAAIQSN